MGIDTICKVWGGGFQQLKVSMTINVNVVSACLKAYISIIIIIAGIEPENWGLSPKSSPPPPPPPPPPVSTPMVNRSTEAISSCTLFVLKRTHCCFFCPWRAHQGVWKVKQITLEAFSVNPHIANL